MVGVSGHAEERTGGDGDRGMPKEEDDCALYEITQFIKDCLQLLCTFYKWDALQKI